MTNSNNPLETLRLLLTEGRIKQTEFDQLAAGYSAQAAAGSAIAQGDDASALAQSAVQIHGNNSGPIVTGTLMQIFKGGQQPGADQRTLQRAYLARLMLQANQLPLLAGDRDSDKLRLSSVYTALLTQRSATERLVALAQGVLEQEPEHLSALDVLDREPKLALLGGPGSGKSTFANVLVLALAGAALGANDFNLQHLTAPIPRNSDGKPEPQSWQHGALLPVLVVLREFASQLPAPGARIDAETLWGFIARQLQQAELADFAPHLKAHLLQHGGLVLLDGLDEVPEAHQRREQIKTAIQRFAETFSRCRYLATSRTYAYQKQHWKLDGFVEAQLLPFLPWQIDAFADAWYAQMVAVQRLSPTDAADRAARLKRAAKHNPRIAELAERPLLLTLMAQLQSDKGGELPEKPQELYERAVEMLLETWESMKPRLHADGTRADEPSLAEYLKMGRERMRTVLNRLAFAAHRDQPELTGTASIAGQTLIDALLQAAADPDVKPQRLEEYLRDRAGILAAHGNGVYQFPHRSFQEYLAACHLTDDEFPDLLVQLARAEPNRWREVVVLAGAKAARGAKGSAWLLAEALCPTPVEGDPQTVGAPVADVDAWGALLAGKVLVDSADLAQVAAHHAEKQRRIRDWQLAILRRSALPAVERALAGRTLAALGDPRPEVMTLDGMQFCHVPAGAFNMGSDNHHDDEKPLHRVELPEYWIARYPVSVAQWREYLRAEGRAPGDAGSVSGRANDPTHSMNWNEAVAFCRFSHARWSQHLPAGLSVVLPSEAQWEKAARGGLRVPSAPLIATVATLTVHQQLALADNGLPQREYPWGDEFDLERASVERSIGTTSALGAYAQGASPYGGEELSGNLWEWTRSTEQPYSLTAGAGEVGDDDDVRVVRGGAWGLHRNRARCTFRSAARTDNRSFNLGFRVVLCPC